MRFYEDLENMESTVEIIKEDETKIFDDDIYSLDELYERCLNLKNSVQTLLELEIIGEDISDSMRVIEESLKSLIIEGRSKFNLSDEDIENIKNDIFGKSNGKVR